MIKNIHRTALLRPWYLVVRTDLQADSLSKRKDAQDFLLYKVHSACFSWNWTLACNWAALRRLKIPINFPWQSNCSEQRAPRPDCYAFWWWAQKASPAIQVAQALFPLEKSHWAFCATLPIRQNGLAFSCFLWGQEQPKIISWILEYFYRKIFISKHFIL